MAITNQPVGDNSTLEYNLDATVTSNSWTAIAAIESITGMKITSPEVVTTKIDSTAVRRQGGIPDYGEINLKARFALARSTLVLSWINAKTSLNFRVTVPTAAGTGTLTSGTVTGFIKGFDPFGELSQNKEVVSDLTIGIDGSLTLG